MSIDINPRKLFGPWDEGYALDVHTLCSALTGHNTQRHAVFRTVRSPIGELLYCLKTRGDQAGIPQMVESAADFVKNWGIQIDAIIPVPPSNTARRHQPVIEVARPLGDSLRVPLREDCLTKSKSTGQFKDVFDFAKRTELLKDAFSIDSIAVKGLRLLLMDDLYRSGATVGTITKLLLEAGAQTVYLLALTQTRKLV